MIPDWTDEGTLPPGVHAATWAEVIARFGWNTRRNSLLLGMLSAVQTLDSAGCTRLWIDGSFVTKKELPNDWDGCWAPDGVDPALLDPSLLQLTIVGRRIIKSKYQGDVLIAGIERSTGLTFVDFFQQSRDGSPKGIVLLNPREAR